MPVHVKVGGAWKSAPSVYNKVSGAWKTAVDMPVKISGAWKTGILSSGAFESIATVLGTGSSNTITFSSIPQTYTSLQIRFNGRCSSGAITDCYVRYNSDTGSNYTQHWTFGLDTGGPYLSSSGARSPFSIGYIQGYDTNPTTAGIIDIHDYSSTTRNKTTRFITGGDEQQTSSQGALTIGSGLWMNTNAITSIDIVLASSNWTSSSTFALYGIKGA